MFSSLTLSGTGEGGNGYIDEGKLMVAATKVMATNVGRSSIVQIQKSLTCVQCLMFIVIDTNLN